MKGGAFIYAQQFYCLLFAKKKLELETETTQI